MGTSSPIALLRKFRFFVITDLADILDQRMIVDQRTDDFIIVFLVGPVDLCRDLQRDAASDGDLDGAGRPPFPARSGLARPDSRGSTGRGISNFSGTP